jgi:hypothetical protein
MRIAYFEPLSRAWERTRVILWQPFDLAKWLLLALAAWLAGMATDTGLAGAWRVDVGGGSHGPWREVADVWDRLASNAVWLPLVIISLMVGLAIAVLVLWVSSRAKFILLDNLVRDRGEIVEPWTRHETLGNSLFLWRLCFGLACGAAALLLAFAFLAPAAGFSVHDALAGLSVAAGFFAVVAMIVISVIAYLVALLTESFVIPIMYRYELRTLDAWRALLPWLKARPAAFLLYALFVVLLTVLFAIFYSLMCAVTCCIVVIPYIGTVLLLPVWVTFRLLSVEFLAQFHSDFDLFAPLPGAVETTPG